MWIVLKKIVFCKKTNNNIIFKKNPVFWRLKFNYHVFYKYNNNITKIIAKFTFSGTTTSKFSVTVYPHTPQRRGLIVGGACTANCILNKGIIHIYKTAGQAVFFCFVFHRQSSWPTTSRGLTFHCLFWGGHYKTIVIWCCVWVIKY